MVLRGDLKKILGRGDFKRLGRGDFKRVKEGPEGPAI